MFGFFYFSIKIPISHLAGLMHYFPFILLCSTNKNEGRNDSYGGYIWLPVFPWKFNTTFYKVDKVNETFPCSYFSIREMYYHFVIVLFY